MIGDRGEEEIVASDTQHQTALVRAPEASPEQLEAIEHRSPTNVRAAGDRGPGCWVPKGCCSPSSAVRTHRIAVTSHRCLPNSDPLTRARRGSERLDRFISLTNVAKAVPNGPWTSGSAQILPPLKKRLTDQAIALQIVDEPPIMRRGGMDGTQNEPTINKQRTGAWSGDRADLPAGRQGDGQSTGAGAGRTGEWQR